MLIGHCAQQYPEKRNIIGKIPGARYKLCRDLYSLRSALKSRLGIRSQEKYEFLFDDLGLNRVDFFHFFNHVNAGMRSWDRPWVTTFETLLPRIPEAFEAWRAVSRVRNDGVLQRCLDALASDRCIGLIGLSTNAVGLQGRFLDLYPEYKPSIIAKTCVVHPPQKTYAPDWERKENHDIIHFALIGHAYFRKGGREIVGALARLRKRGRKNFRLTIVSQLKTDHYATKTAAVDVGIARMQIAENAEWVRHYDFLEPTEVHRLMETVDVGLLPSHAETYGYSVLEFQAHGVPVVTTNIRAFPEINTEACGWVIKVETNSVGEAFYETEKQRQSLSSSIEEQLLHICEGILSEPSEILEKGRLAHERVRALHDPNHHAEALLEVYNCHGFEVERGKD